MIKERENKNTYLNFDGLLDYAEYADGVGEENYSKLYSEPGWDGGSFCDAMKQSRTGNPELVKSLFDDVRILEGLLEEDGLMTIRDVIGDYFDVGEVISGEPECWRREEYALQKPVIPVFASFSMGYNITSKIIINRGAAIVALVDSLEKQGFIIDLHLENSTRLTEYKNFFESIKIKTNPIDLDSMAFILANPLCLRRLSFAVMERINYTDSLNYCSYGDPINYNPSKILIDSDLSGFYFTCSRNCNFNKDNYSSLEAAKKHIIEMMESFKNNPNQVIIG